ncbi:helix-turn-helix domain-containing protein [Pseudalkalibacillus caeni]|uniref:Helix-turn-helix domain-containing protein n=1 Tax=Exobacillus caeni TaxID=2574798 RepID=A0A5R9F814_9BACL|nr:helix-turn-helix domain-containing protein [Pseudalkalibacillus caeni]TLS36654.1 helix-turn-helix domain-containing protein [Pseudalkalibacillus caeni]
MENNFYELINRAKSDDEDAIVKILELLEPKIQYEVRKTAEKHREDLKQELTIKLIKTIKEFDLDNVPDFDNFMKQRK